MQTYKNYRPPRSTAKARYFYIPTTDIVTGPPKGAKAMRDGAARQPSGTYIYNPTNPERSYQAQDVAVQQRVPSSNPTIGAGIITAATASLLIADSGPLAAGTYYVEVSISISGIAAAGKHLQVEHRNAANSATNAVRGGATYGSGPVQLIYERIVVALNERIRVMQSAVAGAASEVAIAHIAVYLLPI